MKVMEMLLTFLIEAAKAIGTVFIVCVIVIMFYMVVLMWVGGLGAPYDDSQGVVHEQAK